MFGDRLREERERLGLSQPAFGAAADGAAKRTVIDWEKGVSSPTGVQLAALFYAGVDVRYVVTGERDGPPPLKAEERVLLDRYRASPPALQDAALRVLLGGEAAGGQHINAPARAVTQTGDIINARGRARVRKAP